MELQMFDQKEKFPSCRLKMPHSTNPKPFKKRWGVVTPSFLEGIFMCRVKTYNWSFTWHKDPRHLLERKSKIPTLKPKKTHYKSNIPPSIVWPHAFWRWSCGATFCENIGSVKGHKGGKLCWSGSIAIHRSASGSIAMDRGVGNGRSTMKGDGDWKAWIGSCSEKKMCSLG
jgi:hypothetical protein